MRGFLLILVVLLLASMIQVTGVSAAQAQTAQDGEPDLDFGVNGQVVTDFSASSDFDYILSVAEGPNQTIIAAGGTDDQSALARYNSDGSLDTSFGQGGLVVTELTGGSAIRAVAVGDDGKIIAGGGAGDDATVVRYMPHGSIDQTFGVAGVARLPTQGAATAMRIAPDGKIYLVGQHHGKNLLLAAVNPDGTPDTSFGPNGVRFSDPGPSEGPIFDQQGRILAYSTSDIDTNIGQENAFNTARYTAAGSLDSSFGNNGVVFTPILIGPFRHTSRATSIIARSDGHVVVAGSSIICFKPFCSPLNADVAAIVVLNADGSLDGGVNYGTGIISNFAFVDNSYRVLGAEQPDHKLVLVGDDGGQLRRRRLLPNGSLDPDFAESSATFQDGQDVNTVAILRNGDFLEAGRLIRPDDTGDFVLRRFKGSPIFDDIAPADYFYDAVTALASKGVISGYADRTFRPFNNTTRGQLAKIIVLAKGDALVSPNDPAFIDVPPGSTFYPYITTAWLRGYVGGYDTANGREFRPQNNVTRGQLAKIVVSSRPDWELLDPATPDFSDVARDNTFYRYIETAHAHSILSGYADGTFRPGAASTRGQISKIIYLTSQIPAQPQSKAGK